MTGIILTALRFIDPLLPLLLTIMIHSTLVLGMAIVLSLILRFRGVLVQVFVLRMFLVAVLAAPFIVMFSPLPEQVTFEIPSVSGLFAHRDPAAFSHPDQLNVSLPTFISEENVPFSGRFASKMKNVTPFRDNSPFSQRSSFFPADASSIPYHNVTSSEPYGSSALAHVVFLMLLRGMALLWITMSATAILRLIAAHIELYRMLASSTHVPEWMSRLCTNAAKKVGVRRPGFAVSPLISSPILTGWIRPVILLPEEWDHDPVMLEQVLLHELYHLAQRDTFWNLVRELVLACYPLQPLMRVVSRRMEMLSDYACDAFVMDRLPGNSTYINNLVALAGRHLEEKYGISLHAGFFKRGSILKRRIRRLLTGREGDLLPLTCTRMAALSAVCTGTVLATVTLAVEYERPYESVSLHAAALHVADTVIASERQYIEKVVKTGHLNETPDQKTGAAVVEHTEHPGQKSESGTKPVTSFHGNTKRTHVPSPRMPKLYLAPGHAVTGTTPDVTRGTADRDGDAFPDDSDDDNRDATARDDSWKHAFSDSSESALSAIDFLALERTEEPFLCPGLSMAAMAFEVALPAAKEINVVINYDFDTGAEDISDAEDRYLYSVYLGLNRKKNEPAWSPDGNLIAFTDYNRIWVVSSQGGTPRMVYENLCEGYPIGGVESLRFSPDGSEITFKRFVYDESRGSTINIVKQGDNTNVMFNNPASNIESINIETSESRVLVRNGYSCDWNPDGSLLLYLGSPDGAAFNPGIDTQVVPMVQDTATGERRAMCEPGSLRYGIPAFSYDGSEVFVTAREKNGPVELYRIPLTGGGPARLTEYNPEDGHGKYRNYPDCSPDGRWVLYTDQTPVKTRPDQRLFLYEIATGEVTPFFTEPEHSRSYGTWSPSGDRICYVENRDGTNYLYIAPFDRYVAEKPATEDEEPQYAFSLTQNYPNPFNAATIIEFSLPRDDMVDLRIFNVLGQQVRTLVSGQLPAGKHIVRWDGHSSSGEDVASGVYVSVLNSGGKRIIRRMTALK